MLKKIGISFLAIVIVLVPVFSFEDSREAFLSFLLKQATDLVYPEIGPHREVDWQQGEEVRKSDLPNIIVILTDDMGFNDISLYGGGAAGTNLQTPHIDSLAHTGVKFINGYAGSATCAPSRAALMSGRYPTRFGFEFTPTPGPMSQAAPLAKYVSGDRGEAYQIRVVPPPHDHELHENTQDMDFYSQGMPSSEITIAEQLKKQGYYTAHIGKWHLGENEGLNANSQGFDDSLNMFSGLYLPVDDPNVVNAKQGFDPIDFFLWNAMRFATSFNKGEVFEPSGYVTDYYTDQAVKVIEQNKNRPFFLYMAHWGIHTPLQATKEDYDSLSYIEDHTLRVYAAMIKSVDRSTGRIIKALEENGLTENTLIIFTSDNGGAHYIGLENINKPFRGWKATYFEGGTHVPFLAKWPKRIPAGSVFEPAVSHLDVFATASAAAGIALPDDRVIDGVDFVPYILGEKEGVPHETLFWRQSDLQTIIHKGWKMHKASDPDRLFLFHLAEDPTEQINLADKRKDKIEELELEFAKLNAQQVDPLWSTRVKMPVAIDYNLSEQYSIDDVVFFPN